MTTKIPAGYKQTSAGIIPKDWEVKELSKITTQIGDGIHGTPIYSNNSDYFFVNGNNLVNGKIQINSSTKTISEQEYLKHKKDLNEKTILISINGTIGNIAKFKNEKIILGKSAAYLKFDNSNLEFFYQLLHSFKIQSHFEKELSGSTIRNLSLKSIRDTKLPLPPLSEQQKIAEILSTWDEAIETCQKTIEELKLRNKGLAQQLLSGKTRVKGLEDTVWKFIKIGDILSESAIPSINESNPDKRITVKLNLNGIEKRDFRGTEVEGATYFYTRKAGQFIYGKQNLHKGAFGIIPDELDNFDSSSDIPTFDFSEKFSPHFILYYFSRKSFYERLENYSTGTGSKRIQPKELFKVEIKIPDYEEQKRIVEILDTAASELKRYEEKLQNLKLQKKGMMQVLLTGKVRTI